MRSPVVLVFALALASSCGSATLCQSSGALSDAKSPPGARPAPADEQTFWNQAPPPDSQPTSSKRGSRIRVPARDGGSIPMSSPRWRPTQSSAFDGGVDTAADD